jgi:hypothetical protein
MHGILAQPGTGDQGGAASLCANLYGLDVNPLEAAQTSC